MNMINEDVTMTYNDYNDDGDHNDDNDDDSDSGGIQTSCVAEIRTWDLGKGLHQQVRC